MQNNDDATPRRTPAEPPAPTDLADLDQFGSEWAEWVAANPDLATEVVIARRVRLLLEELRAADFVVPADFEARVLARCQRDASFLALLDLGLFKSAQVLLDLLSAFFAIVPQSPRTA